MKKDPQTVQLIGAIKDPRDWSGPFKNQSEEARAMGKALRKHSVVFDDYDNYRGYWILKAHPEYKRLLALCILAGRHAPRETWAAFNDPSEEEFFTINIGVPPLRDPEFEEVIDDILGLPHRKAYRKGKK
jgi:hypothetical protein